MVYALLILSLDAPTTVWFSSFYTPEGNDRLKKKRQQFLARRVREEHNFRFRCVSSAQEGSVATDSARQALAAEDGVAPIIANELFAQNKVVVWEQVARVAFVLVLESHENRLLAANFLSRFITGLADHFRNPMFPASPKEILGKSEDILVLLHHMLPNGQLLFANRTFIRHLRQTAAQNLR